MGVVLVLHGQAILADMEDGHVWIAVDHALAGEDRCFVLGLRVVSSGVWWGGPLCPQPIAWAVLGSRRCISMLDELQSVNV